MMERVALAELVESLPCSYGDDIGINEYVAPVVKVGNVSSEGNFKKDFEDRSFSKNDLEKLLVNEGELLVVKSSGSKANILSGKTAICPPELSGKIIATNFLLRLKVKNGKTVSKFLWFYLNSTWAKDFVKTIVGTTTYPNLKWDLYSTLKIPLPDLKTQQKIASILEQADAAREKRRQANALTEQFLQSAFIEMFGDPMRNERGWNVKEFGDCISYLTSGSRGWAKYYSEEGDLFIRIENVGRSKLFLEEKKLQFVNAPSDSEALRTKVQEGDLLISITADLGRTAVVPKLKCDAYINQHLALARLKEGINSTFITYFFSSQAGQSQFQSKNKGGVKAGLNFADIRTLKILLPPLPEQNKFAQLVEQVEKLRSKQRESEMELENLFQSLMQKYFG